MDPTDASWGVLLPWLGSHPHPGGGNLALLLVRGLGFLNLFKTPKFFNTGFLEVILKSLNVRTESRQARVLCMDPDPGLLSLSCRGVLGLLLPAQAHEALQVTSREGG